jgi:hypothetical protein
MIPAGILILILDVICCAHVVRTGREFFWLFLIILFQPLGAIVYLVVILLPDVFSARGAKFGRAALRTIDPTRGYREAQIAVEDSPTVYNRMALGEAAAKLGRFDEAAEIYRQCLEGPYADDQVLLMRYAACLVELGQFREGLRFLDQLGDLKDAERTPQVALLMARAHEGLGDMAAADREFAFAADRIVGPEGHARYAAFLAAQGRMSEAEEQFGYLERRVKRAPRAYRREAAQWRDFAASALSRRSQAAIDTSRDDGRIDG